jgi:hypothetical protein
MQAVPRGAAVTRAVGAADTAVPAVTGELAAVPCVTAGQRLDAAAEAARTRYNSGIEHEQYSRVRFFYVGMFRIRIRIRSPVAQIRRSGSVSKRHGSGTLALTIFVKPCRK